VADLFISHASEDKDDFVRPLAQSLAGLGLDVWYDEFSLEPGDSLRESIDKGLAGAAIGVVCLSPHFFAKRWPKQELDGLFAAESAKDEKLIVPIWHSIDQAGVAAESPMLAGRKAIHSRDGVESVAKQVESVVSNKRYTPPGGWRHVYRHQTVTLNGIPRGSDATISRFKFLDCVIQGPGVMILGRDVALRYSMFEDPAQFWPLEDGRGYLGGIVATQCYFERCSFIGLGIAVAANRVDPIVEQAKTGEGALGW
jgi:hypothetical protein